MAAVRSLWASRRTCTGDGCWPVCWRPPYLYRVQRSGQIVGSWQIHGRRNGRFFFSWFCRARQVLVFLGQIAHLCLDTDGAVVLFVFTPFFSAPSLHEKAPVNGSVGSSSCLCLGGWERTPLLARKSTLLGPKEISTGCTRALRGEIGGVAARTGHSETYIRRRCTPYLL